MDLFSRSDASTMHLVVDAGGFIKHVDIQKLGQVVYTLPEVVSEIKDKNTRERLAVLPFDLIFREPPADFNKTVSDFAKKTGDFSNLSATDIKVIALTLLLHKEHDDPRTIREEPTRSKVRKYKTATVGANGQARQASTPGFFLPKSEDEDPFSTADSRKSLSSGNGGAPCGPTDRVTSPSVNSDSSVPNAVETDRGSSVEDGPESVEDAISSFHTLDLSTCPEEYESEDEESTNAYEQDIAAAKAEQENNDGELEERHANNTADDDNAGWITPSNIAKVYKKMGIRTESPALTSRKVACLTTDFSVQNVVMQMGMHIIGADGMYIKTLRTYVLRCFGCYKITHDTSKRFCPSCGNSTLKRVCMTLDKNGQPKYHISTKRPLNIRGTKFSLPMPKGGKHAVNPILSEDQPTPHFCAPKKSMQKLNVFDPDYVARDSPFLINDLTSRAALLGRRGHSKYASNEAWMAKNPNAVRRPKK